MVQFLRVRMRLGDGAAMPARQSTRPRHLPEEDEGAFGKIAHGWVFWRRHARILHAHADHGKPVVCLLCLRSAFCGEMPPDAAEDAQQVIALGFCATRGASQLGFDFQHAEGCGETERIVLAQGAV